MSGSGADTTLSAAMNPTRDLSFFTLTAFGPIAIMAGLLLMRFTGKFLTGVGILCAMVAAVGFGRLLYETTMDVAGYPEYKLPVWAVLYMVLYLISGFTFVFLALGPGSFTDALYTSLIAYVGNPSSGPYRFVEITETILSMFVNVVIITKFVSAF